jgi:hypothetical protein
VYKDLYDCGSDDHSTPAVIRLRRSIQ